jgi:hypothetical protein
MRVELLQKSHGTGAAAKVAVAGNWSNDAPLQSARLGARTEDLVKQLALVKSTFALSNIHAGKSFAFKRFFLPVVGAEEAIGRERADFLALVKEAIASGAALQDESEYSAQAFDPVATKEDCGKGARVRLRTVLGQGYHPSTHVYGGGMPLFSFHGVYAEGNGIGGSSHREVGDLRVRYVERVFQEELGDLREYSPWMDIHTAIYDNDLDSYVHRFSSHGVPILALRWPAADEEPPSFFYSLIVHVPDTQEIFEIISATAPSDPSLSPREFPMARHVFRQSELSLLRSSWGPTPIHIGRSHYDLDAVKAHYARFFQLKPVHEALDADTGIGFVSFWHQSYTSEPGETDVIRVQVMYWNRPDQSMTVAHTTAWLERRLEQLNSQYMRSYTSCWPVWGDNHYSVINVPLDYYRSVQDAYDSAGVGYMLFRKGNAVFTGYFPLPGGMYIELQPINGDVPAPADVPTWVATDSETGALYCYRFTCPA